VTGYRVTGYRVTGYRVTGYRVTGYRVTGYRIQGDRIQGDRIQGDRIQGDRIQGDIRHSLYQGVPDIPDCLKPVGPLVWMGSVRPVPCMTQNAIGHSICNLLGQPTSCIKRIVLRPSTAGMHPSKTMPYRN